MKHSYSKLSTFEHCPKQYAALYVYKTVTFKESEALIYGREIHKSIEQALLSGKVPFHLGHLLPIITHLREQHADRRFVEQKIAVDRNWQPVKFDSPLVWIRGVIDYLHITNDALVIDWKTGTRRPDKSQLLLYGTMLIAAGVSRVRGLYLWLNERKIDEVIVTKQTAQSFKQQFAARVSRVEKMIEESNFPAYTSPLCQFCPCLMTCPEGREYRERAYRNPKSPYYRAA